MATEIWNQQGRRAWELERDDDGHRTYKLVTVVRASSPQDGPATVINTAGLPATGSYWQPALSTDIDVWATCWPTCKVGPLTGVKPEEPFVFWAVEQTFSTKPRWRCQDATIEDPLLEPYRIGGSFVKYTQEAHLDRFGKVIRSSSWELFRGSNAEWDANRPSVWIEQNDSVLGLAIFAAMIDKVNDAPLWGLPPRCVKLSNCTWERKVHGQCNFYYTRRYEFDVNPKTFDREIPDHGSKYLFGSWSSTSPKVWVPDPGANFNDPSNFEPATAPSGNLVRSALLDGGGQPLKNGLAPFKIKMEKYEEDNFFILGIPPFIGP